MNEDTGGENICVSCKMWIYNCEYDWFGGVVKNVYWSVETRVCKKWKMLKNRKMIGIDYVIKQKMVPNVMEDYASWSLKVRHLFLLCASRWKSGGDDEEEI